MAWGARHLISTQCGARPCWTCRTNLAKGSFRSSKSVERWYLRISLSAASPGRSRCFRFVGVFFFAGVPAPVSPPMRGVVLERAMPRRWRCARCGGGVTPGARAFASESLAPPESAVASASASRSFAAAPARTPRRALSAMNDCVSRPAGLRFAAARARVP
ncbi:unnamed protein product, partial [Pelagomonas calceolata]